MGDDWVSAGVFLLDLARRTPQHVLRLVALSGAGTARPPAKFDTYECSEALDGPAWVRFHPRYYIVALLFVLFDVEAAFCFHGRCPSATRA